MRHPDAVMADIRRIRIKYYELGSRQQRREHVKPRLVSAPDRHDWVKGPTKRPVPQASKDRAAHLERKMKQLEAEYREAQRNAASWYFVNARVNTTTLGHSNVTIRNLSAYGEDAA